jgi:hypothetical protein
MPSADSESTIEADTEAKKKLEQSAAKETTKSKRSLAYLLIAAATVGYINSRDRVYLSLWALLFIGGVSFLI